jgi:radical SAM protein with 4Fe4S-binding SPASM domain
MIGRRLQDFTEAIQQRTSRFPLSATIELTHRCPLTCAHCYNNLSMADRQARRNELTLQEHCKILDELAEAGCLKVTFTGGEIFARKDFLAIYTHAKQRGLLVTLFTNGTLITPRIADYLVEWRPLDIEITLYGRTCETYERLTGIPGSYARCLQGIRLLRDRKLPLQLKTVAVSINLHEVLAMQAFAEELGVPFRFDAIMNPRTDCSQSPLAVRLTPEQVVQLDVDDSRRRKEWTKLGDIDTCTVHGSEEDDLYTCGGGMHGCAIDPYGKLSICVISHQDEYDLRAGSFREGWEQFLLKVRAKKRTRLCRCRSCELRGMCPMCPAQGELTHRDAELPVDFLCEVTHLRAQLFGKPIPPHGDCPFCEGGEHYEQTLRSVKRLRDRKALLTVSGKDEGYGRSNPGSSDERAVRSTRFPLPLAVSSKS